MVIPRTLLQEQLCRFGTQRMPPCHIPEVVFRSRLVREKVELPAQGRQTLLLRLQELRIIPPCGLIRAGTHYVQRDRSVLAFEHRLQAFQTTQQELRLGAYAISEVVDTVVRQIENGIGHVTPSALGVAAHRPCLQMHHDTVANGLSLASRVSQRAAV